LDQKENVCPVCGKPGHGPYVKTTRNRTGGKVYHKYAYMAHKVRGADGSVKTRWCYIGEALAEENRRELPNRGKKISQRLPNQTPEATGKSVGRETTCLRCRHFTTLDRPFCEWLQSFLTVESFNQPCEGFKAGASRKVE